MRRAITARIVTTKDVSRGAVIQRECWYQDASVTDGRCSRHLSLPAQAEIAEALKSHDDAAASGSSGRVRFEGAALQEARPSQPNLSSSAHDQLHCSTFHVLLVTSKSLVCIAGCGYAQHALRGGRRRVRHVPKIPKVRFKAGSMPLQDLITNLWHAQRRATERPFNSAACALLLPRRQPEAPNQLAAAKALSQSADAKALLAAAYAGVGLTAAE